MATVAIARAPSYGPTIVRRALAEVLAPLGGMAAFVARGDRVLVKPNFLAARPRDSAVATHPEVILAVAEAALDAGAASVVIGDSPGIGSATGVAKRIGLSRPARERGLEIVDFSTPVEVANPGGGRFRRFEIERSVLEVDTIINLAKLKTHQQMFLTLAVKNTFGCVVGVRKVAWHFEAGRDADLFAEMLLDLHYRIAPALNIVDGIVMMEGNGPGTGRPRDLGVLAASADAAALDRVLCERLLSLPLDMLPTHGAAARLGHGTTEEAAIQLAGVPLDTVAIDDVVHPRLSAVANMVVPRFLRPLARRLVEVRPVVTETACSGCGVCLEQCPAGAITMHGSVLNGKSARIEQAACIHCYCCQELCPEGAIAPRRGLARRLLRRPTRG
jgi:uncharacterized protein (DUF362 family)/Pyruvate/2-oxoacid:ferredoxin oxidoreductase delta subunit